MQMVITTRIIVRYTIIHNIVLDRMNGQQQELHDHESCMHDVQASQNMYTYKDEDS